MLFLTQRTQRFRKGRKGVDSHALRLACKDYTFASLAKPLRSLRLINVGHENSKLIFGMDNVFDCAGPRIGCIIHRRLGESVKAVDEKPR